MPNRPGETTVRFSVDVLLRLDEYVRRREPRGRRSGAVEQAVQLLLELDRLGIRPDQALVRLQAGGKP